MKKSIKYTILGLGLATVPALTGCIEETFPASSATSEQVSADPKALEIIVNSLANYMAENNVYGSDEYTDGGLPGYLIGKDVMCEDFPVYDTTQDWWHRLTVANHSTWALYVYYYYYTFVDKVNEVLRTAPDPEEADEETRHLIGNLYGYRAMCFMDLARYFTFYPTGYPEIDNVADQRKVHDLTVPILEAREYSLAELVANNRAPFWTMYRFIMDDLNKADELLEGYNRTRVSMIDRNVVNGFKARMWLELASRFERNSDDLAKQIAAEGSDDGFADLGIRSVNDCYVKAGEAADKVIAGGFSPLTPDQWHDPDKGFSSPDTNTSWVFGTYCSNDEERVHRYRSHITHACNESEWGFSRSSYKCWRMISKALYDVIPDSDWRKKTWIAPEDAGNPANKVKYSTGQTAEWFAMLPAYAGFKFRCSNYSTYQLGLTVSTPFMRVEEMYLIKAEVLAHTSGVAAGVESLKSFVNTYRMTDNSYNISCGTIEDFNTYLMRQRRIEFWGEGIVYWDYKRLRLGVTRTYSGTNFPENQRLNTADGVCTPWMNLIIGDFAVSMKGPDFVDNPKFNGVVKVVTE